MSVPTDRGTMKLREYFASMALPALICAWYDNDKALDPEFLAVRCYAIADAMLAARGTPLDDPT